MKKRLLVCGVACGLACALCVFLYTEMVYTEAESKRAEALQRYGGEQVEVLVATKTIHPGEALDPSNCTTTTWLSDLLPEGALLNMDETEGKQATSLILQGEVISSSRFDNETKELDIPAGSVAIALPAQEVQAVGGSITVGSKVDVYATGAKTTCLGRDLEVLATSAGTEESSSRSKITWVTLAVDPEKTQEFVAASQSMDIYFTLPSAKPTELANNSNEQPSNVQTSTPSDDENA
jgi:pilus assembly protein CpaB